MRDSILDWFEDHRRKIGLFLVIALVIGFVLWLTAWAAMQWFPTQPVLGGLRTWLVRLAPALLAVATVYPLLDVWLGQAKDSTEEWTSSADCIRRQVEIALKAKGLPGEVSRCTLKVWAVDTRAKVDGGAKPLVKVWESLWEPGRPSNIQWCEGKGVIGCALAQRKTLHVRVGPVWKGVWATPEEDWAKLSTDKTFGCSYAEFQQLRGQRAADSPYVMAVPISRSTGDFVGVSAMDAPDYMGTAIGGNLEVEKLLRELGQSILDPNRHEKLSDARRKIVRKNG